MSSYLVPKTSTSPDVFISTALLTVDDFLKKKRGQDQEIVKKIKNVSRKSNIFIHTAAEMLLSSCETTARKHRKIIETKD